MKQDKLFYASIESTGETLGGGFENKEDAKNFMYYLDNNRDNIQEYMPDTKYKGEDLCVTSF